MAELLLIVRLALTSILLLAGVAKLVDLGASRRALIDFGLPNPLLAPLGILLPTTEIVIALTLLWTPAAIWGAMAAVGLFTIFAGAIGFNLWHGRKPPCGCFGRLDARPIGRSTLVRAIFLTALAAVVVWRGPGLDILPVVQRMTSTNAGWLLVMGTALTLLVVQGGLIFMLVRQQGRLLLRLEKLEEREPSSTTARTREAGLPVGSPAPHFHVESLTARATSLSDLSRNVRPVVLLFTDPDCPACTSLSGEINNWRRDFDRRLTIAVIVISVRDMKANGSSLTAYGSEDVYIQRDRKVAELYKVVGTPTAILIRGDLTIGSRLAEGAEAIRELMRSMPSPEPEFTSTAPDSAPDIIEHAFS